MEGCLTDHVRSRTHCISCGAPGHRERHHDRLAELEARRREAFAEGFNELIMDWLAETSPPQVAPPAVARGRGSGSRTNRRGRAAGGRRTQTWVPVARGASETTEEVSERPPAVEHFDPIHPTPYAQILVAAKACETSAGAGGDALRAASPGGLLAWQGHVNPRFVIDYSYLNELVPAAGRAQLPRAAGHFDPRWPSPYAQDNDEGSGQPEEFQEFAAMALEMARAVEAVTRGPQSDAPDSSDGDGSGDEPEDFREFAEMARAAGAITWGPRSDAPDIMEYFKADIIVVTISAQPRAALATLGRIA